MFARKTFGEKGLLGSYYGSLPCADIGWELQSKNQYGEQYMEVTEQSFLELTVDLKGRVSDSRALKCSV